ncbi:MAG: hypothetical protein FWH41_01205 [Treponema sp.]|nr:hypothetical protein [Treponema sp.]
MKIITVKDIIRKDVPIYYRLLYTGVAIMEFTGKTNEHRIDFTIEIKPTGYKEIIVNILDKIDYPLVPVIKELKNFIDAMHLNGMLPD